MAKPKYFLKLRQALERAGDDQKSLGPRIDRSDSYVSCRFRVIHSWDLEDIYKILDLIHVPYEQMHEYFPRYGGVHRQKESGRRAG